MRKRRPRQKAEPTIALINVVFLMLIFFMVAGTLAPPTDPDLTLVNTGDLEGREPAYALVLTAEGELRYRGQAAQDVLGYLDDRQDRSVARIMPDREASATRVLEITRALREAGAEQVLIVTEKARQ